MNHNVIGGIVNNLPIEKMVAAPLTAAIKAQSEMSMEMAKYIESVGVDSDGNMRMVTFTYTENANLPAVLDGNGNQIEAAKIEQRERHIQAPFLAMTGIPNLAIEHVNIAFEIEVTTAEEEKTNTSSSVTNETTASFKKWWSPVQASTKFTGSVSHSKDQTRRTDTRAKYSFDVSARKQGPPEALMRIIDTITNAATVPVEAAPRKNLIEDEPAAKAS
jgi:hypothetical protein